MLFDEQRQFLQPLIYIPEIQSLIWENSCGSGTASLDLIIINVMTHVKILQYISQGQYFSDIKAIINWDIKLQLKDRLQL